MCWQSDEGAQWKGRLFDLEMKGFSDGFDMPLFNVIISVHLEYRKGRKGASPVALRSPHGEVTTQGLWAGVDNKHFGRGALWVCGSPSVAVTLVCAGTAALMTALRGSKPKFHFHGICSNAEKTQNRVTTVHDLKGFDTPSSLAEIIAFFIYQISWRCLLSLLFLKAKQALDWSVCIHRQWLLGRNFQALGAIGLVTPRVAKGSWEEPLWRQMVFLLSRLYSLLPSDTVVIFYGLRSFLYLLQYQVTWAQLLF